MHYEKITVWCGLLLRPYFFRDGQDRHVTVNGNRYRSMITEYFWPQLHDMDLKDMWFQQDVATSHTTNVIINLLETKFGERVISRNGPVGGPPRSYDLTTKQGSEWIFIMTEKCFDIIFIQKALSLVIKTFVRSEFLARPPFISFQTKFLVIVSYIYREFYFRKTISCGATSSLWYKPTSQRRLMHFVRISNVKLQ